MMFTRYKYLTRSEAFIKLMSIPDNDFGDPPLKNHLTQPGLYGAAADVFKRNLIIAWLVYTQLNTHGEL